MIRRRAMVAGGTGALVLAAAGCAAAPTRYYRLAMVPGTPVPGAPVTISVRGIDIPGYLDKDGVVASAADDYEVTVESHDLWAEPLAGMLQAVLVQNLAQRLPGANVLASGGAIGAPGGLLVEVNVLRFDPAPSGVVLLQAQIAVKPTQGQAPAASLDVSESVGPGGGVAAQVAAMSALWARLADKVAAMVAGG